jgi:hypothetical protein
MWKSDRQYYDVIRVPKRRRGRRDIFDWIKLLGMAAIALVIVGYVVKLYAFPAAAVTDTLIYLPLILR